MILQREIDLSHTKFASTYLLPQSKTQLEVDATVEFFKNSLSTRILSFVNYFRLIIRTNNFATSLNTNILLSLGYSRTRGYIIHGEFTQYDPGYTGIGHLCDSNNIISSAAFFPFDDSLSYNTWTWREYPPNETLVNGFFTGCIPLEALLQSTLDCLYDISCLQLLADNFPSLNQVKLDLFANNSILYFLP